MIKLMNLQRRVRTFNLEHETFVDVPGENGEGKPETLTLFARETREVHEDVLKCVEVKAALNPKTGRATLRVLPN